MKEEHRMIHIQRQREREREREREKTAVTIPLICILYCCRHFLLELKRPDGSIHVEDVYEAQKNVKNLNMFSFLTIF